MADQQEPALPDGTDTVIEGSARTANEQGATGSSDTAIAIDREDQPSREAQSSATSNASAQAGLADRFRTGREQLASQAGDRARGLVSQGLDRTSEALANVSKMVGDTASGIEERLGPEYGDYARRAAGAIENVANTIAEKDPDELIDDARNFVRNSPGIALAGAAVVGFVIARLLKSGLAKDEEA